MRQASGEKTDDTGPSKEGTIFKYKQGARMGAPMANVTAQCPDRAESMLNGAHPYGDPQPERVRFALFNKNRGYPA
jgi:hypothetical protein